MSNQDKTPEPYDGMWDWDGACRPEKGGRYTFETFSIGCFQWVKKSRGSGLKRGKVQYRIKGSTWEAEQVYAKARAYCAKKNTVPEPRT